VEEEAEFDKVTKTTCKKKAHSHNHALEILKSKSLPQILKKNNNKYNAYVYLQINSTN